MNLQDSLHEKFYAMISRSNALGVVEATVDATNNSELGLAAALVQSKLVSNAELPNNLRLISDTLSQIPVKNSTTRNTESPVFPKSAPVQNSQMTEIRDCLEKENSTKAFVAEMIGGKVSETSCVVRNDKQYSLSVENNIAFHPSSTEVQPVNNSLEIVPITRHVPAIASVICNSEVSPDHENKILNHVTKQPRAFSSAAADIADASGRRVVVSETIGNQSSENYTKTTSTVYNINFATADRGRIFVPDTNMADSDNKHSNDWQTKHSDGAFFHRLGIPETVPLDHVTYSEEEGVVEDVREIDNQQITVENYNRGENNPPLLIGVNSETVRINSGVKIDRSKLCSGFKTVDKDCSKQVETRDEVLSVSKPLNTINHHSKGKKKGAVTLNNYFKHPKTTLKKTDRSHGSFDNFLDTSRDLGAFRGMGGFSSHQAAAPISEQASCEVNQPVSPVFDRCRKAPPREKPTLVHSPLFNDNDVSVEDINNSETNAAWVSNQSRSVVSDRHTEAVETKTDSKYCDLDVSVDLLSSPSVLSGKMESLGRNKRHVDATSEREVMNCGNENTKKILSESVRHAKKKSPKKPDKKNWREETGQIILAADTELDRTIAVFRRTYPIILGNVKEHRVMDNVPPVLRIISPPNKSIVLKGVVANVSDCVPVESKDTAVDNHDEGSLQAYSELNGTLAVRLHMSQFDTLAPTFHVDTLQSVTTTSSPYHDVTIQDKVHRQHNADRNHEKSQTNANFSGQDVIHPDGARGQWYEGQSIRNENSERNVQQNNKRPRFDETLDDSDTSLSLITERHSIGAGDDVNPEVVMNCRSTSLNSADRPCDTVDNTNANQSNVTDVQQPTGNGSSSYCRPAQLCFDEHDSMDSHEQCVDAPSTSTRADDSFDRYIETIHVLKTKFSNNKTSRTREIKLLYQENISWYNNYELLRFICRICTHKLQ